MDSNEAAIEKSNEVIDELVMALRDLADNVDDGNCNDPATNLFDADAFWQDFNDCVRPLVKTVIDNQKMD